MEETKNETETTGANKPPVSSSYLRGQIHVHDIDFSDFAKKHGKTEDEVINNMVEAGWTQGCDTSGNYEYWEPVEESK